jgi:hypothetical protein
VTVSTATAAGIFTLERIYKEGTLCPYSIIFWGNSPYSIHILKTAE